RAADVGGAHRERPVGLRPAGEVRMGSGDRLALSEGEAIAIPTGGAVPEGADAVVPIELCSTDGERVWVLQPAGPGEHVRPAGEDAEAGDVLVPAGRRLLGPDLGLLASSGTASAPVHPRVRVGVVSTGDELVPVGRPLAPGRIHDANAFTLIAAVEEAGGVAVHPPIVPDDPDRLVEALDRLAEEVDVLISSGGVAVGERDPVKRAFAGRGEVELYEVAMQPGKPQAFGSWRNRPFFGLPGNAVSVFVSFEVFVRPALMRMMGRAPFRPEAVAVLEEDVAGLPRKTRFARVRLRRDGARLLAAPTGSHRSSLLTPLAGAHGLAVIPAGVEAVRAGHPCPVIVFRDPEEG
ncbi:MAG TPA: gephyrin-like molybdotransferase Glp, partial [Actinomycetota bacterium]